MHGHMNAKCSKLCSSSMFPSMRGSPKCCSLFWSSNWTFLCIFQLVLGVMQDLLLSPITILSLYSYFTNSKNYDSELCDSVLGSHSSLREEQVSQRNFWLQAGQTVLNSCQGQWFSLCIASTLALEATHPPSTWGLLFRNKAAYAWRWPFTSFCCLSEGCVERTDLLISMCLHVMLFIECVCVCVCMHVVTEDKYLVGCDTMQSGGCNPWQSWHCAASVISINELL